MEGQALTAFERRVLDACLVGSHPDLDALRKQAESALAGSRTHTGIGAYLDFVVAADAPRASNPRIVLGDVDLNVQGVPNGVATMLYALDGVLKFIEFATYDDAWPHAPDVVDIRYLKETGVGSGVLSLQPVRERDPSTLGRAMAPASAGED
jgi:hypothetical protein